MIDWEAIDEGQATFAFEYKYYAYIGSDYDECIETDTLEELGYALDDTEHNESYQFMLNGVSLTIKDLHEKLDS